MTLGQRIQELRKRAGLTQEQLAEQLGVTRQAVSKWESDNGVPELDALIALSRYFNLTLGELLGVEEPRREEFRGRSRPGTPPPKPRGGWRRCSAGMWRPPGGRPGPACTGSMAGRPPSSRWRGC